MREFSESNLVHQDIVEYSKALLIRLKQFLNSGFEVLCEAYLDFKDFDVNPDVVKCIMRHSKLYAFRHFERTS